MVKIDLVTGFLGSGKTTFLKKYAKRLMEQGQNIGILENDFGAVNVDMMLLQELEGEQCELEMISGGCDPETHRRRFRTKLIAMGMCGYDRVLVEPSGIYDMDEFFDVLHEEPLDQWYEIGNVIAVVDARLEDTLSPEAEYLLASQAANAGCMILSKCDTATEEQRQNTIAHLKRSLAALGCKQRADQKILCEGAESLPDQEFAAILSCGYYIASYEKPDFAKGQAFESLYFLDMHLDGDAVTAAVKKMLKDPACGHIFRVKGFLQNPDGTWLEINATQQEITRKPIANGQDVLIVIGENLVDLCDDGALSGGTRTHPGTGIKKEHGVCAV